MLLFYTVYFGSRDDEYGQSLFFVALLLPITMATTYAIVYWLVPRYLLTGRIWTFVLYVGYSLLLSLHLELSLMVGLYMTVADYQALFVEPTIVDLLDVLVGMYVVVFGALSIHTARRWRVIRSENDDLEDAHASLQAALNEQEAATSMLSVRVDRKNVKLHLDSIDYVESQGDYVLLHTHEGRLMTKQTLSAIERELTGKGFIRIHRSFLVRAKAVRSFTSTEVEISSTALPIGRSFKDETVRTLQNA